MPGIQAYLYQLAHGRTGDKGNRSNISVIAWHAALYPLLVAQVTEEAVREMPGRASLRRAAPRACGATCCPISGP
jgi:hypothetical protein